MGYEDDHASVKTVPENEVRSEYSGVRGGGRKSGQTLVARPSMRNPGLGGGGQMPRANTIHRALVGQNQILKVHKAVKKPSVGGRRYQTNIHQSIGSGAHSVSLKAGIRDVGSSSVHTADMRTIYATSQQPQRSQASAHRGFSVASGAFSASGVSAASGAQ